MFDFKTYKSPTDKGHAKVVDMVAGCVYFYRQKRRPLKTIYLWPIYYKEFRDWAISEYGEEKVLTSRLEFDGVAVVEGTRFQKEKLQVDFWAEA